MKLKLSMMAASLALAFSGSALAGIANTQTGNGELFLAAWYAGSDGEPGTADDRTYVRDLGNSQGTPTATQPHTSGTFDVTDIVSTAATPSPLAAFTTGSALPILSFTADANWGSFVSNLTAQQRSNIQFAVLAGDGTGSNAGNSRFLMTVNGPAGQTTNSNLDGVWDLTLDTFIANTNALPDHAPPAGQSLQTIPDNSSVFLGPGAANAAQAFQANLGAGSPQISGAIGSQLDFWLYNNTSATGTALARNVQFVNAAIPALEAYWQLNPNGDLIYAVPVPEPGTWAMLAAGLIAVGGIARRRIAA
jgi:hypothetical protein